MSCSVCDLVGSVESPFDVVLMNMIKTGCGGRWGEAYFHPLNS